MLTFRLGIFPPETPLLAANHSGLPVFVDHETCSFGPNFPGKTSSFVSARAP
jgi:hypothetical protein